eukprot:Em0015g102a
MMNLSEIVLEPGCANLLYHAWYLDDGVVQARALSGFCKLSHLARATPPSLSVKALELFDQDILSWIHLVHHASTCKRGGDAVHRHNLLRDVFADSCRLAHLPVKLEVGNNLTPDHDHSRPADVLVHNWSLGKPAAFDFCVTSPLNSLILSEAGVSSGVAAQASEIRKHNSNDAKCVELGWVCIPLVVETYGAWGQEAVKTFAQLASRLAIACSKPKSVVINEIYGRLNTCLMRSISSAILTRIVPS